MYLMCGPRQLFFFQCGPETPKGWTPLAICTMEGIHFPNNSEMFRKKMELSKPNIDWQLTEAANGHV